MGLIREFAAAPIARLNLDAKSKLLASTKKWWEEAAGEELRNIQANPESALWFVLNHESATIRRVAISVLHVNFPPTRSIADACESVIQADKDNDVRCGAITLLSQVYAKSNERRIGRLLAEIVRSDAENIEVRQFAYRGLFRIRGVPVLCHPRESEMAAFPEKVNWAFVDSFLDQK